jgi:RNA polymerase sigma-70 factor (sigma-E family)
VRLQTDAKEIRRHDRLRIAYERHQVALLRLCCALTGSRMAGEDLVQDSFVRVAPRIELLQDDDVWPYLRKVAINLWRDRLRRVLVEFRHLHSLVRRRPEEPAAEINGAVWDALARLPSRQRTCVILRYYEDLPERDVAALLGCSIGTVKSQTSRGLDRLRRELIHGD